MKSCTKMLGKSLKEVEWHHCKICVLHDDDLHFQDQTLQMLISEMVKASGKISNVFVFICHGMALGLLRMFSCITLSFTFNVKHFLVVH